MDPAQANQAIDGVFAVLAAPERVNVGFLHFDLRQRAIDGITAAVRVHGADAVKAALASGVDAAVFLSGPAPVPTATDPSTKQ